ncbi:MAG: hypothetical protein WDZ85_01710 [Candidatus Paceibacterota bacterium]
MIERTRVWPEWLVLAATYVYLSFTPLPNDLLIIILAMIGVSLRRLWPVILAGSLTIVTLTAYLASYLS